MFTEQYERYFEVSVCHDCHQVDAAQGAAEMVEQLTEKMLEEEEHLQQLEEEKSDLVSDCL